MAKDKDRVIELQKSLKIARDALERIRYGHCGNAPHVVAEEALDRLLPLEPKRQIQGLVGHDRR